MNDQIAERKVIIHIFFLKYSIIYKEEDWILSLYMGVSSTKATFVYMFFFFLTFFLKICWSHSWNLKKIINLFFIYVCNVSNHIYICLFRS